MKTRKITKKVDAILCADIHLREDQPVCRTDNFWITQWQKIEFISDLQKQHNCPIWHSGDLFHHWKPSPYLLSAAIHYLPNRFCTVYGNHDLPQHNLELNGKSGLCTLEKAGAIQVFQTCHWNQQPDKPSWQGQISEDIERRVLIWHVHTYQGKLPWPGCNSPMGAKLLRQYPAIDLIVTGDNHIPFVEEFEGRLLVNPGSMTRQKASETHNPRVYLWHAEDNSVTPVYLPIQDNVVTRDHLEKVEERDSRIEAFVEKLNDDWEGSVSFEENLNQFEKSNKIDPKIMQIIRKAIEVE